MRRGPGAVGPAIALAVAAALVGPGCGPKPVYRVEPLDADVDAGARRPALPPAVAGKSEVWAAAQPWLGTPYRYGGHGRGGIDCSALAQNIVGDLGVTLPRTVDAQRMRGQAVTAGDLDAGDLVFFRLGSYDVNHVGVMIDRNRFVHASSSRGVVVDLLMDGGFAKAFAGGRRVIR